MRLFAETLISSGETVPAPRALDELIKDPDVTFEIKEGAVFVALPTNQFTGPIYWMSTI